MGTITFSSILFLRVKEQWRKLIEQDVFTFSYFIPSFLDKVQIESLIRNFIKISPFLGIILSAKVWYTYCTTHTIKGFWGGNFIIGNLLALPIFSTLFFLITEKRFRKKIFWGSIFVGLTTSLVLPMERSIIIGFLGALLFFILLFYKGKTLNLKRFLTFIIICFLITFPFIVKSPKIHYWWNVITNPKISYQEKINTISSGRIVIARGALQLIDNAIKQHDYIKLLIGWGYGPQKQYKNLPGYWKNKIDEYESLLPLTVFINGGLLGLIFVLWFYIALIKLSLKVLRSKSLQEGIFISAVWVNAIYHLFTLFWVPINAIFYIFLALVEKNLKKGNN